MLSFDLWVLPSSLHVGGRIGHVQATVVLGFLDLMRNSPLHEAWYPNGRLYFPIRPYPDQMAPFLVFVF